MERRINPDSWRLDNAVRVLRVWLDVGDIDTVRKMAALQAHLFPNKPSDPHRDALDCILGVIERALTFEKENGAGSFLNIDHPFVRASIEGRDNTYGISMLQNAVRASTQRKLFNVH